MFRNLLKLFGTAVLATAAAGSFAQSDVYSAANHDYKVVTIAEDLVQPWSMAWLPGGDMLITEKPGRLRVVRDGSLLPEAVPGVPDVFYEGQGGLFDVLPHPNFSENRWVYLTYSKETEGSSATAIARGRFENDRLSNVVEIFEAQAVGFGHYGGKIVFDNDGYMFLTLGDRMAPPVGDEAALRAHPAQDRSNHQGVIVRLNDDGTVPTDNPYVGDVSALDSIWSRGHRSPQGLEINPLNGDLWSTEMGPRGGDELNIIGPGNNYGWPLHSLGINYSGTEVNYGRDELEYFDIDDIEMPLVDFTVSAVSSFIFYKAIISHVVWQHFSGLFSLGQLARLQLSDDYSSVVVEETLVYDIGRIRDVRQGLDGYIYLAVSDRNGDPTSVVRLEPAD